MAKLEDILNPNSPAAKRLLADQVKLYARELENLEHFFNDETVVRNEQGEKIGVVDKTGVLIYNDGKMRRIGRISYDIFGVNKRG